MASSREDFHVRALVYFIYDCKPSRLFFFALLVFVMLIVTSLILSMIMVMLSFYSCMLDIYIYIYICCLSTKYFFARIPYLDFFMASKRGGVYIKGELQPNRDNLFDANKKGEKWYKLTIILEYILIFD